MEIWKDIPDYEGLYQVSNLGRVKSSYKGGRILKPLPVRSGYLRVALTFYDGSIHFIPIHRLVLIAFSQNMGNMQVNHINGIKTDNRLENLEWVTRSENMRHAYKLGLEKPVNNGFKKRIVVMKNGITIGEYQSIREMCRDMGFDRRSVQRTMSGRYAHHHGYTFREYETSRK